MARVLIVDDSATIRLTLELILKKQHKTLTAVNGQDALSKLEYNVVDVIVSDIHMPVMGGHELLYRLREDRRYRKLPVIMLTQSSDPADLEQAKERGADCYLSKPVSSHELLDTITHFVQENENATKPLPPLPPIDRAALLPLMGHDVAEMEGFLAEALPLFAQEANQMVQLLKQAVDARNMADVEQISHSLRGSGGSLGASRLAQLCFDMETAAKQGITDGMLLKLIEIQAEVARIRAYTNMYFPKSTLSS